MPDVHVVPDGDGWDVEEGGDVVGSYATQVKAVEVGLQVAGQEAELVVHREDGQVWGEDSNDGD